MKHMQLLLNRYKLSVIDIRCMVSCMQLQILTAVNCCAGTFTFNEKISYLSIARYPNSMEQEITWLLIGWEWLKMLPSIVNDVLLVSKQRCMHPYQFPQTKVSIGRPWKILSADILYLKLIITPSACRCLLVVMNYFTKWVEAVP